MSQRYNFSAKSSISLGALVGYDAIEEKWKRNLELADVILEMADDLCYGCLMGEYSSYRDPAWENKYLYVKRKPSGQIEPG